MSHGVSAPTSRNAGVLVTVAICTLDRALDLNTCLESLASQSMESDAFEVLVVDNGPSSATRDVVSSWSSQISRLRYTQERRRGLTYARRRAWHEAEGEYVAFVDDDAVACPGWLEAIEDAFRTGGNLAAMVGGPVHDVQELREPWPFTASPGSAGLDMGPEFRCLGVDENLWGGNSAFRREVLERLDAFGEPLGHRKGRPGANEDILIQRLIDRSGWLRFYSPEVQLVHNSWRAAASERELNRLAFFTGVDDSTMARLLGQESWGQRSQIAWGRVLRLRSQAVALARAWLAKDAATQQRARRDALLSIGMIAGAVWPPRRATKTTSSSGSGNSRIRP